MAFGLTPSQRNALIDLWEGGFDAPVAAEMIGAPVDATRALFMALECEFADEIAGI